MKVYHLRRTQHLPISLKDAWDFFSSPQNLSKITPTRMNFKIVSISGGEKMFPGQIIRYKINVLPWLRLNWVTEITQVHEPEYFIDEQRVGPYALWHHRHHFKEVPTGVEMTDELNYAMPLGIVGRLVHALVVEREVNDIFNHRFAVLENFFESNTMLHKPI